MCWLVVNISPPIFIFIHSAKAWNELLVSSSKWNEVDPPLTSNGVRIARDSSVQVQALIAKFSFTHYKEVRSKTSFMIIILFELLTLPL